MKENEESDLWEGVQIMAPGEVETSISPKDSSSEETTPEATDDELEIIPVTSVTSGIDKETEDDDLTISTGSSAETNSSTGINKHAAIIKDMINAGVINGPEDEEELKDLLADADSSTIEKLMEATVRAGVLAEKDNWKNGFTGAKKRFLEIETAFNDTDQAIQMAQRLEFLDSVSDDQIKDNKDLQKQMYYQHLKSKNFTDAEAIEAIEEADEIDKLESKALGALPSLKRNAASVVEQSKEQTARQKQQVQEKYANDYKSLMSAIDTKDEFITGLKLNKTSKDKIKSNISTPVYKDQNGRELTSLMYKQERNPSDFQMLINYYDTIGLFNIDKEGNFSPNIGKLKNVAKTRAVSELDSVLAQDEEKGLGHGNSGQVSSKTSSTIDFLEGAFNDKKRS